MLFNEPPEAISGVIIISLKARSDVDVIDTYVIFIEEARLSLHFKYSTSLHSEVNNYKKLLLLLDTLSGLKIVFREL